jgi:hypothetical protein
LQYAQTEHLKKQKKKRENTLIQIFFNNDRQNWDIIVASLMVLEEFGDRSILQPE